MRSDLISILPPDACISRKQLRPRFRREILETAHDGVDVALQRLGQQRMQRRRRRGGEMPVASMTGLSAAEPCDDAAVEVDVVGLEDRAALAAGDAVEMRRARA